MLLLLLFYTILVVLSPVSGNFFIPEGGTSPKMDTTFEIIAQKKIL
jgi:hypothetical protein